MERISVQFFYVSVEDEGIVLPKIIIAEGFFEES
jgi:hypothetical protein